MHGLLKLPYDRFFHLAAQSFVPFSFMAPGETLRTNVIGTLNLLDAIKVNMNNLWVPAYRESNPAVLICSSSEVYGQVRKEDVPITEDCPLRPASPYAVSKVGEDMLGLQYYLSYGMKIIRTRAFTHTGPRRGPGFCASSFAKQIAEIEARKADNPIHVGNLDSVRTWADVRDIVKAYWKALCYCKPGEVYNVGGDRTATVGEVLEMLKVMARCKIEHVVEPTLLRPSDVTLQIPDTSKFRRATGWEPEIPLEETLLDLLDYWRQKVRDG